MYFESELNQNPEKKQTLKEEKSEKGENAKSPEKKVKKKVQISAADKQEIKKALSGKPDNLTAKKKSPSGKKVRKQINAALKKQIVVLLQDKFQLAKEQAKDSGVKTAKPSSQISKNEEKAIRALLNGKTHVGKDKEIEQAVNYNLFNKQELVEMLEETVEEKNINLIKNKVGKINKAFHKRNLEDRDRDLNAFVEAGGIKEDYVHSEDPLEKRFKVAFNQYKKNKARHFEELEKQKVENLEKKNAILDELKTLIDSNESLKKTYDEFNRLQERWKEIGMIPASELNNLWQNYHFLVEMFFDKVRINKELRDLDLKKNLEKKIALCEKAEELLLEKSIIKSFKLLQKYHEKWREIGPVPSENREEMWERFKSATSKINDRRKEYYKTISEEQEKNYEAKVALCEKIEQFFPLGEMTLKEWQKKSNEVNEVFKMWKTIGRASKSKNDEIWLRFKSSLDSFFDGKKEYLSKLKEQQMVNLNLKTELCVKAEAIKDSEDWKNTTNELIRLQKEWKKIGPVPRRHSDKVWKRFRAACDEFFNSKAEHFGNLKGVEKQNLKNKNELIEQIKSFEVTGDKEKNLEALKSFQRKWIEIGLVPYKDKDDVLKNYRQAVDNLIDKMKINRDEHSKLGFRNKIEFLKNEPDASRRLNKERSDLLRRINKIKEDVALWENNIGFFSSSKQSEALKKEFEKKIEDAKKEIEIQTEKLKMLDSE